MKFLLTNDDGIDAPGLAALAEVAAGLGDVAVVAPVATHSGCSHRVTTHEPILVDLRGDRRAAVRGTPADCVRVALHRYCPDFDWVLAGINAGGNLGADVYLSGTVSAVREAVLHGRPGIAFSCYKRRELDFDWPRAARWVRRLLPDLLARPWEPGVFWNVNLPHPPGGAADPDAVWCRLDPHPLPLSFRDDGGGLFYDGNYHGRQRTPGRDVDVCFRGQIAVTRLNLFD
jgi:5'-nucleotidase